MSLNSQIADLILERGRAQAQGQAASGQAWGVALSQIGNTLAQLPQEIRRDKIVNQQQQMGKLQIESAQRQGEHEIDVQRTRQAMDGMMNDPSVLNEDGTFNIKSITSKLSQMPDGGVGPVQRYDSKTIFDTLDPINQSLSQARDSQLKYQEHKANALAGLAAGALRLGKEDGQYFSHAASALASAQKSGLLTPDEVNQTLTHLVERQEDIPQVLGDFVAKSTLPLINRDPTKEQRNPLTNELVTPATPELKFVNGQGVNPTTGAPVGAPIPKQATPLAPEEIALKKSQLAEIDAKLAGTIPMSEKDKAELRLGRDKLNAEIQHWKDTDEGAPILTPEAKRIAAQQWAMTGQMVAAGMGKAGTKMRADIMNEAGEVYKGLNLPAQMAAFKANEASLVRITGTLDNLTSFEKAANKNIDTFINLTKNLPDTGVPWANMPLRLLSDKMVGSEYLPAIQAARQIATREVARVVNDPGLKGELTDAARKGVDAMLSGDITIAQMKQVLPVFRSDMDNVRTSLSEQQKDIASRIASPPGTEPPTAKVPDAVLPGFTITRKPGG